MRDSNPEASQYLQRAAECDRLAETALFEADKKSFRDMAESYRRMAAASRPRSED